MAQKLIIIRGNSGSGKSTIAQKLRPKLGEKTMFLQQDVLRHDIFKVSDKAGNPVIGLIDNLVHYGHEQGYDVLLEGILTNNKYGEMLKKVVPLFDQTYVYYLDIPFNETIRRHSQRNKQHDFGEQEMRTWWREKDYLGVEGEQIINETWSEDEIVSKIMNDAQG